MTLIVDSGPVVAMHDRRDAARPAVERLLRGEPGSLVIPASVTGEIDFLLGRRGGRTTRLRFIDDLAAGRYQVEALNPEEYLTLVELEHRYADLDAGLADLSIVVLAHRYGTTRIATFDERHFRALRPLEGGAFVLLPRDEP